MSEQGSPPPSPSKRPVLGLVARSPTKSPLKKKLKLPPSQPQTNVGGQPPAFVTTQFNKLSKRYLSTKRFDVECKFCAEPYGHAQSKKEVLEKHILQCDNAPLHVKDRVRAEAKKSQEGKRASVKTALYGSADSVPASGLSSTSSATAGVSSRQLPRQTNLFQHFDAKVTAEQQDQYDLFLLQLIIHAGLAFSVVENPYFIKLMKAVRPSWQTPGEC